MNPFADASFDTAAGFINTYTDPLITSLLWSLGWLGMLVLLRLVVRRDGIALTAVWLVLSTTALFLSSRSLQILTPVTMAVALFLLYRFGLVAMLAFSFARQLLFDTPLTLDFSAWYSVRSMTVALVVFLLAAWAFHTSLGGKPMFGNVLADEEQAGG